MDSAIPKFLDIVNDFAKEAHLQELAFDANGNCVLEYGDAQQVTIHYTPEEDKILIFAEVCDLENSNHRKELFERMLKANLFWKMTYGFTLSLGKDDYTVVAMAKYDCDYFLDSEQLEECLTNCAELARGWREMAEAEELPSFEHGMTILEGKEKAGDDEKDNGDEEDDCSMSEEEFQRNTWRFIRI